MRTASLIMLSGLFVQVAHADEIRHATFPNVMLSTWAETAEQCAANCAVSWIVETAGASGINYAVHALCTSASLPEKNQADFARHLV